MSTRTKAAQQTAHDLGVRRHECADAGPYGAVCTLPNRHDDDCYDGVLRIEFPWWGLDTTTIGAEWHPYDCGCGLCVDAARSDV